MAERNLQAIHCFAETGTASKVPQKLPLQTIANDGPFIVFRALASSVNADLDDDFSCTLTHDKLSVVDEVHGKVRNFLNPAEVNPLLLCLKQFWDMERFRQASSSHIKQSQKNENE